MKGKPVSLGYPPSFGIPRVFPDEDFDANYELIGKKLPNPAKF